MDKEYHIEFKSGDPQGSALWYAPTPINYAILYANYGFFLHDAYWRAKFGPGSNLPHPNDGLAFDAGSHGCINFPGDQHGVGLGLDAALLAHRRVLAPLRIGEGRRHRWLRGRPHARIRRRYQPRRAPPRRAISFAGTRIR